MNLADRIKSKVSVTASGCWEWSGKIDRHGYGHTSIRGRHLLVHRVSYETFRAQIPTGFEIDHLCKNARCCNPNHLEAVTGKENRQRAIHDRKGLCRRGLHLMSGSNLAPNGTSNPVCRQCRDSRLRKQYRARSK